MNKKIITMYLAVAIICTSFTIASAGIKTTNNDEESSLILYEDIVDLIKQVNESTIYNYLDGLLDYAPRYTGSENCKGAARYIANEFQEMGLDVYIDPWRCLWYVSENVIATHPGSDPSSDAVFIICAHYDTIKSSPGANDDGSGIAIMLTIAKILSQYSFNHTIKFIAFSGEDVGLHGSKCYARKAYEKNDNIIAVFNIDTIGSAFTERGGEIVHLLCPERNLWISDFFQEVNEEYSELINLTIRSLPNHACDQGAFNQYGYDGIMLMQYESLQFIHSPEDKIEHLNFTYMNKSCKLILAATAIIADRPIELQVRIVTPQEGAFYIRDKKICKTPKLCFKFGRLGKTYILGPSTVRINVTSNEELEKVIYCVNDLHYLTYMIGKNPPVIFEWQIRGYDTPLFGTYKIGVYVYTVSGKVAYDEMDITTINFKHRFY